MNACTTDTLVLLREQVQRIERRHVGLVAAGHLQTGLPAIDAHLQGGLRRGALHEFSDAGVAAAASASTRFTAGILAAHPGQVVWLAGRKLDLHASGLRAAGFDPGRLICVEADPPDALGLAEDILRERGLLALVLDLDAPLTLTASRRLQLAAEQGGVTGLVIHRHCELPPSACQTRWRLAPVPGVLPFTPRSRTPLLGPAHWQVELLRQRAGRPGSWFLEVPDHAAPHPVALAAALAHRSVAPASSGPAPRHAPGTACA